jgi:phage tail sheath protein FI
MPALTKIITRNTPGVYVSEDTYGSIPALLADHGAVYVMGTCTNAAFPFNTPVYISNYQDFLTQVTSSPSAAAVQLFFDQRSGSGLNFIRVPMRQQTAVTVTVFTAGTVLTVTVGTATVSYTCVTGETALSAADNLGNVINSQLAGSVSYIRISPSLAYIRTVSGTTATASANVTLAAPATGATPLSLDVADSLRYSLQPELPQGYICAPEFFQAYANQVDRTTLQQQLEAFASDPRYYWVSVVDMGQTVSTVSNLFVNSALTERNTYVSPRGNSWVSYPYVKNLTGTDVPSSLVTIGIALRRARSEGFIQPPAGVSYPVYGIQTPSILISADQQGQLNAAGINCIRVLPGRGTVVYGARTLSVNPFYRFAATRVILNVLAGTLLDSFDSILFSLVDGQGALFTRVRQTANNICEQLRLAGGLFGSTAEEAYLCVCDLTNNTLDSLETGAVYLDVIAKPSPTMEAINITLSRASLSTTLAEVTTSGDTALVKK